MIDHPRAAAIDLADEIAKPFEGLRLDPYHDPVGYPTIGYGHLLSRKVGADLSQWKPITEDEAETLLQRDMAKAANSIIRMTDIGLEDHQLAALIDFAFNCGAGNYQVSTLRKKVNRGDFSDVPRQLSRWVYARGVKLPGLIRRRAAEAQMWAGL